MVGSCRTNIGGGLPLEKFNGLEVVWEPASLPIEKGFGQLPIHQSSEVRKNVINFKLLIKSHTTAFTSCAK